MSSQWGAGPSGLDGHVVPGPRKSRALLLCTFLLVSSVALLLDAKSAQAQTTQTINVSVDASPDSRPEPGGSFTYTVTITNNDSVAVTLNSLTDSIHGNVLGSCPSTQIAAGATLTCQYTRTVTGDNGDSETNTVTAIATPVGGGTQRADSDTETVTITDAADDADITVDVTADPASRPQPGGSFTYTVRVQNVGNDGVTLTALSEDGSSLNDRGTCDLGGTIAAGQTFTCTFSEDFTGNNGDTKTTTVTATAADDDAPSDTDTASDSVTVSISTTDSTTGFTVTKTASPTSRVAPGGTFTFSIVVNNSTGSSVTLNTLSDSVYGNLDGRGTCDVPQTISSGSSYSCQFSVEFTGSTGRSETNTVTASGTRSGGGTVSDTDTETITITGTGTLPPIGFNPFNPLNPFLGGVNPFGAIGSTDTGRGPIVVTNNNSSSSSSSAAASVAGGAAGAPPPGTPTQPPTLVRTGIEALPMAAAGMAILLLGFVMLTAGNRRALTNRS
jgi:hypothetical protein